ncbi:elongation factor Ts [bacterium BMS3Abin02]|nr:elongation factor Ts [bacterium BMS3Abin02]GBE21556.1 elongation factor Ts [bacterium BMS3Bbin01]HDH27433.1 translation elongation factor Ts [Actinomycetota bacterium]HDL48846.1 translation elongation factor Ts [Actinomycetota bacterium]
MADFTAKDVQKLRQTTGAGMMDAKKALVETAGDFEKAKEYLREKGLADAKKRAGREANEGVIGVYLHRQLGRPVIGVLVELASETDFVAKSGDFLQMANDIAMHVAAAQPRWVRREDVPADALEHEREMISRQARNEGKPENIIPRIVEGKIGSFYKDHVLEEQPFVKTETFDGTVGEMVAGLAATMGENIRVRRFARLAVGEET